jgi:transposase InsO family protein
MSTSDYQQWVTVAKEMGYSGDELRKFVTERQAETREERARERELEKARLEQEREKAKLDHEKDLEKSKLEREHELEKVRLEKEHDREKERETRQMEIEREKLKMEQEKLKMEQEVQLKQLEINVQVKEIEARMSNERAQIESQERTDAIGGNGINNGHHGKGMKNIKFPNFNENKDCLDAYLVRFERTCGAYEVPHEQWSLMLATHLEGKALEVYQRLTPQEAQDYEYLREQLLKRFQLTESGYRRRFKESKIEPGETPSQFVERLRRYIRQWILLAGYDETYEGLESLILKDQFFNTCSAELRIFIKERGHTTLPEMLKHAESYIEAHGYKYQETIMKQKPKFMMDRNQNKFTDEKFRNGTPFTANKQRFETETHRGANQNRFANKDWNERRNQTNEHKIVCYICKQEGHKANNCSKRAQGQGASHTAAAMMVFENTHYKARAGQVNGEAELSTNWRSSCRLSDKETVKNNTVASILVIDNEENKQTSLHDITPTHQVQVNGKTVECLFDSGATCCIVKRTLVNESTLTGNKTKCMLIDGSIRSCPTAIINIHSDCYSGSVEALVMDNPVKPVIIGKIDGLKYLLTKDKVEKTSKEPVVKISRSSCEGNGTQLDDDETKKHTRGESTETQRDAAVQECNLMNVYEVDDERCDVTDGQSKHNSEIEYTAAVETRESSTRVVKYKPLKVMKLPDLRHSPEQIKQMQQEDDSLKKYWKIVKEEEDKEDFSTRAFIERDGLLYKQYREVLTDEIKLLLVVPQQLRDKVMTIAHCTLLSAHLGIKKTHDKINNDFYWPSMGQDIRMFVMSCDICQRAVDKKVNYRAPMGHLPVLDVPFQCICVDLVGPINPMSSRGYRYVLTAIDLSTRYPEAIPLKGISTEEVAEALFEFYCRMGVPDRIHTDRGSQFTSELMAGVNKMLLIKHTVTSPYHAMGNGCVERLNGTIKATLRKMIGEQPKEWDRYLAPILFALRDTVHESHGYTPFELVFGRSCRGPVRILKELWTNDAMEEEEKDVYTYMLELRQRIEETCVMAKEAISQANAKNKKYYDKRARSRKFEVNEKVLLLLPSCNNKLLIQWQGPFRVKQRLGDHDYRIEISPGKIKTYHINMLKKYIDREDRCEKKTSGNEETVDVETVAYVSAVVHDGDRDADGEEEILELYNSEKKETYRDVDINPELSSKQKEELEPLLKEYGDIFSDVPGRTNLVEHEIVVTNKEPVRLKGYPTPYHLQTEIDKELEIMLKNGIIERSEAAYAAPLVVVKKSDGTNRLCCNYKQLNKVTVFDPEPMMSNEEIFNKLSGSKIYSKFDFCKGYWQIPMSQNSKDLTTFICANGMFKFNVMPFGLVNSASSYNRMIRKILYGTANLESYVDDILAHTQGWKEHMMTLRDFFERVRNAHLTLKPKKCSIGYGKIDFLGHTIKGNSISPKVESIDKIMDMPRPQSKKQVRSFLGAVNYYRKFIPHCAELTAPLSDLTKKKESNTVKWTSEHEESFKKLKEALAEKPIVKLPDLSQQFIIQTDASGIGIGCVLMQKHEDMNHPVAFASRKLLEREKRYSVEERECLAIMWGIEKFDRYLFGKEFVIETDHCGLQYMNEGRMKNARVMRWSLALQNYRFKINYIKGCNNVISDYLSRGLT